jgi:hypothetical protein
VSKGVKTHKRFKGVELKATESQKTTGLPTHSGFDDDYLFGIVGGFTMTTNLESWPMYKLHKRNAL